MEVAEAVGFDAGEVIRELAKKGDTWHCHVNTVASARPD